MQNQNKPREIRGKSVRVTRHLLTTQSWCDQGGCTAKRSARPSAPPPFQASVPSPTPRTHMAEFGLSLQTEEAMQKGSRIWVAGHKGLVGSAIVKRLQQGGYTNVIIPTERVELTDSALTQASPTPSPTVPGAGRT